MGDKEFIFKVKLVTCLKDIQIILFCSANFGIYFLNAIVKGKVYIRYTCIYF